jgi:hypothetical protein
MANPAFSGNDSEAASGDGVQRAALKRITGAAAVGANYDAEDENAWLTGSGTNYIGSEGSAKKRSYKPRMSHALPTVNDPYTGKGNY